MDPYTSSTTLQFYRGSPYRQHGYGLMYYRGSPYRQKGHGLGSFFGNLMSRFIPFARKTLLPAAQKYVLPHATAMVKNVASDILSQNQNLGESLRQHGLAALKGVGKNIIDQSGSGLPRSNTRKRKRVQAVKKRRVKKSNSTKGKRKPRQKGKKQRIRKRTDIFG